LQLLGYEKRFHTAWVKRRNTRGEQMFSAVLPAADIRRERGLGHAEGVARHPADACMRPNLRDRPVDPSTSGNSSPPAPEIG